jgi:ribosomal protein S18 acetylase RimI-like enzyme
MTNISLEKISVSDVEWLQEISKQTFIETFAAVNTVSNMLQYLNGALSIQTLSDEMMKKDSEFYFAKIEDKIVGYLKLNFGDSQTESIDENGMEIERIYVLKAFHRQGIGQYMFDKAVDMARQKQLKFLWLGVWEENHKALNFYKKNGLVEFDKHNFILGNDVQTDVLMKMWL